MLLRHAALVRTASLRDLALQVALLLLMATGHARALDPPEASATEPDPMDPAYQEPAAFAPEPDWTLMWNRPSYAGVLSGTLALGILAPGEISAERNYAGAFQVQALAAGRRWPIMLGLGGGNLWLAHSSQRGPRFSIDGDDDWYVSTTVERSLEIRHVELMARFQPLWGWARPYLEGFFGMSILRQSGTVEDRNGEVLAEQDTQRSVGMLYGGSLGVDLGRGAFAFTLGVKYTRTSPLDRIVLEGRDDTWRLSENNRSRLDIWSPFLGVTLTL